MEQSKWSNVSKFSYMIEKSELCLVVSQTTQSEYVKCETRENCALWLLYFQWVTSEPIKDSADKYHKTRGITT